MKTGKKGYSKDKSSLSDRKYDFKVSFNVDGDLLEFDINENLHIPYIDTLTPAKLFNLMAENPSSHARWNVLCNNAAYEYEEAKLDFEIWMKDQSKTYREELASVSGKRVTDKMVEEAVITDPDYRKKFKQMLEKKRDAANVKAVAIGFDRKGDRLANISSLMKSEKTSNSSPVRDDDDIKAFSDD